MYDYDNFSYRQPKPSTETAELQRKLEISLGDDRVVTFNNKKARIAMDIANKDLSVSDTPRDPKAIVVRSVLFMALHRPEVDKQMLMLFADTTAEDYRYYGNSAPISADDLLRSKRALACAFDQVFPQRNIGLRQGNSSDPTASLT